MKNTELLEGWRVHEEESSGTRIPHLGGLPTTGAASLPGQAWPRQGLSQAHIPLHIATVGRPGVISPFFMAPFHRPGWWSGPDPDAPHGTFCRCRSQVGLWQALVRLLWKGAGRMTFGARRVLRRTIRVVTIGTGLKPFKSHQHWEVYGNLLLHHHV